jgi:hypothetical protein
MSMCSATPWPHHHLHRAHATPTSSAIVHKSRASPSSTRPHLPQPVVILIMHVPPKPCRHVSRSHCHPHLPDLTVAFMSFRPRPSSFAPPSLTACRRSHLPVSPPFARLRRHPHLSDLTVVCAAPNHGWPTIVCPDCWGTWPSGAFPHGRPKRASEA